MTPSRLRLGRIRLLLAVAGVVAVLGAGCTPDPIEVEVAPERAVDCDDLIPTGVALAVQLLAAIETVPIEVLTGDAPATGQFADLLDKGRLFDERVAILDCDPVALNESIMSEIEDDVDPRSLAATVLLDIMQGGAVPDTTSTVAPAPSESPADS